MNLAVGAVAATINVLVTTPLWGIMQVRGHETYRGGTILVT
jgi:hypothetical protein